MSRVRPEQWTPVGVGFLEPVANQVVRSDCNALVVAGPGAGKTELLAQRASFLLDTGICAAPNRILAISFKRDAAKNLGERVQRRCGDRSRQFDSLTLDAFAKSLVDRFLSALPKDWRPLPRYEVMLRGLPTEEMRLWLERAGVPEGQQRIEPQGWSNQQVRHIFDWLAHGEVLPYAERTAHVLARYWGLRWWRERLTQPIGNPSLSFPMLNRLAAFLLRENPKITRALRSTYSHVFLDEFQDTTAAQYDLIQAAFLGSNAVLTAVGDTKQRIMVWADAKKDIFDVFSTDFQAVRHALVSNFRSAPELVRIQHLIAQMIEPDSEPVHAVNLNLTGTCEVLEFANPEAEAEYFAEFIQREIHIQGKNPRDFCIIVRQRTSDMIQQLVEALARRGIRLRDESRLQDLLSEPVVKFLLAVFRLATRPRDAEAWEILTEEIAGLLGMEDEEGSTELVTVAKELLNCARNGLRKEPDVKALSSELVSTVTESAFRSRYRQYVSEEYFWETVDLLASTLQERLASYDSPGDAVDDVIGLDIMPAMTIHKSKGLEFHTVIFLGLEDSQWWNFANESEEEIRGFFVAFSRARERVVFTFSDFRDESWGRRAQNKTKIGDLYTVLRNAGVPSIDCR
jgi:DNA helicase-2/ATP-dependent DNA helicase PcrA